MAIGGITRVTFNITLTKYQQDNETGELVCICPETVEFTGSFVECVKYIEGIKSEAEACGVTDIYANFEYMSITYYDDDDLLHDEFRIKEVCNHA